MLTYEYYCESCEENFKIEQSIKEEPLTECPFCATDGIKRLIGGGSCFVLKGSGWHADLYSKPSEKKNES